MVKIRAPPDTGETKERTWELKNLTLQIISETLEEPVLRVLIEHEVIELASFIHELTKKRSRKNIEGRLGKSGWLGQELFNGILLQNKISNLYANPIYEDQEVFRKISDKHFDFFIPTLGYLSVKTVPEGARKTRFMANVDQWRDEVHDYAVAIKIESLEDSKAWLYGWLYESEVESLPIHDFGGGNAYWTYLDRKKVESNRDTERPGYASKKLLPLHPASDLVKKLLDAKKIMEHKY